MGDRTYFGYSGGLYPGGTNTPPSAYLRDGIARAREVQPRDGNGQPHVEGVMAMLAIGMSNTSGEFNAFRAIAAGTINPHLTLVDGAQLNQDALAIADPSSRYWAEVQERLRDAGVSNQQVQVVWLKEAIARECAAFPEDAKRLKSALLETVQILSATYSNLQLIYLSSRTYGGYATIPLNPEPHAYHSGFAVKWVIEDAIAGKHHRGEPGRVPWVGWGPYLWTDGMAGRSDGLVWTSNDVLPADGTHPSIAGQLKVARLLLGFFQQDETARSWFGT